MTTDEHRRPRARWVLPTALLVAVAAVAGGFLAHDLYQHPTKLGASDPIPSASASPNPLPPAEQPGDPAVKLSVDAELHPDGERVKLLLQRYFDAINSRDFQTWRTTVTKDAGRPFTEAKWQHDYESTYDGTVLVQRVEAASTERLRAMISFTSVQDPTKAPLELPVNCIRWHVVYPLRDEDGTLRVDAGPEGYTPQFEAC
ncbi:hypothetical protein [Umezawaea sp. Da 62-37]|uniref:hypothetical protein n=1 Tax=Umezawaea sp. Da 62-37 TaxID=3075927 RepID=UPI0028F7076B|nr:hypothetical protein [Umezawaea sp. Da 62-37]WNV83444.1 hypothetical protein RM788_35425 [Umezawaea sp. Da 62-37]